MVLDSVHGTRNAANAIKSSSASPARDKCNSSFDGLELQQPSSLMVTAALIHAENGVQRKVRKNDPRGMVDTDGHTSKLLKLHNT